MPPAPSAAPPIDEMPAAVMVVLRYLMQEAAAAVEGAQVAMVGNEGRGLTLASGVLVRLFHAAPALGLPSGVGAASGHSTLDLHVLFTCVGDEQRYEPARLLGRCMAQLDAYPKLDAGLASVALREVSGHGLREKALLSAWPELSHVPGSLSLSDLASLQNNSSSPRGPTLVTRVLSVPCSVVRS